MSDPDEPTRAWQPDDDTQPGHAIGPSGDETKALPTSDDPPRPPQAFVPAPTPTDATRVSPQVGPAAYDEPLYAESIESQPVRSNGPVIAVVVLLALILAVALALLVATLNKKDNAPATTTSTTTSSTTAPSTTAPSTTAPSTTAPSTTAPPTTAPPTTAPPTTAPPTTAPPTTAPPTTRGP